MYKTQQARVTENVNSQEKLNWYNKGCELHFNNYEEAIKYYDRAIEIDPYYTEAYAMKGTALSNHDRHLEAIQCYDKVLAFDPDNLDILSRKASTFSYLKHFQDAADCLEKVFKIDPKNMMYLNIVHNLCELGRPEDAVKACEKYLLHNVDDRIAYSTKARVERDFLGDFNKSLISYNKFFQLLSKNNKETMIINNAPPISTTNIRKVEYIVDKIICLNALGRYQDALDSCNEGIGMSKQIQEVKEKESQLLYIQAKIYLLLERYENALAAISQCEKLSDDKRRLVSISDLLSLKGLVLLLINKSNIAEAECLFDESLKKYNKSIVGLVGSGVISLLKNKNMIADNYFKQADDESKMLREKLEVYLMIGKCCTTLSLYQYAYKFLEKALKLKSDYLPALLELKQLPDISTSSASLTSPKQDETNRGEKYYKKAKKCFKNHEYKEALKYYNRATKAGYTVSQTKIDKCNEKLSSLKLNNSSSTQNATHYIPVSPDSSSKDETAYVKPVLKPVKMSIEVTSADFKIISKLGEGGFGIVYKGQWKGNPVAIKKLKINTLSEEVLNDFTKEAQVMSQLRHPQIINFYKICTEPGNYCILMEYCEKGSLYDWLKKPEAENWNIRLQIGIAVGKGLSYLHQEKLIHRDLKSLNILLDIHLNAKISDFGLSSVKTESASSTAGGMKGTLRWNPPELISGKVSHHSYQTDIYSYGMVLWELASRKIPYAEQPNEMIVASWIANGKKEEIPRNTPPTMAALIGKCWDERSSQRPTAKDVFEELERTQSANELTSTEYQNNSVTDNRSGKVSSSGISRGYKYSHNS